MAAKAGFLTPLPRGRPRNLKKRTRRGNRVTAPPTQIPEPARNLRSESRGGFLIAPPQQAKARFPDTL